MRSLVAGRRKARRTPWGIRMTSGRFEDPADRARISLPRRRLGAELGAAARGERVVACASVVLGESPLGGDRAGVLQAMERLVQRRIDDHEVARAALLDPLGDG